MSDASLNNNFQWYAIRTLPNQENQVEERIKHFAETEELASEIAQVLIPVEQVTEFKNRRKSSRTRKLYPGYIFVQMRLYDEQKQLVHKLWQFIKNIQGVIDFTSRGGPPLPVKNSEMLPIINQMEASQGKSVMKVEYAIGDEVKIIDGPFISLTGRVDEIDPERGCLKVSVSMFGRFTPVELEYRQVERS
jgi:transcription termination/antitermination protein NusG